jgi:hypothetical protein
MPSRHQVVTRERRFTVAVPDISGASRFCFSCVRDLRTKYAPAVALGEEQERIGNPELVIAITDSNDPDLHGACPTSGGRFRPREQVRSLRVPTVTRSGTPTYDAPSVIRCIARPCADCIRDRASGGSRGRRSRHAQRDARGRSPGCGYCRSGGTGAHHARIRSRAF